MGIVYFIQDCVTLTIKIGFCLQKPEKRLAALQTGNSNLLKLVGHLAGSDRHEKQLHCLFAQLRIQGEWFAPTVAEEIVGIIRHQSVEEWLNARASDLPSQATFVNETGSDRQA